MSEEQQVSNEPVGNIDTSNTEVALADASVIAESKKYRKRSQAAETRVAELEAQINSFETNKLKEKEEFKTLYEKVSVENEQNKVTAEKWNQYEATKREQLLQQVPDEEKAEWNDSPLNLLEKYVSKANTIQPQNPDHVVAKTRQINDIPQDWTKMSKDDKKKNWSAIVSNYIKN
jgi:hypothetical protein